MHEKSELFILPIEGALQLISDYKLALERSYRSPARTGIVRHKETREEATATVYPTMLWIKDNAVYVTDLAILEQVDGIVTTDLSLGQIRFVENPEVTDPYTKYQLLSSQSYHLIVVSSKNESTKPAVVTTIIVSEGDKSTPMTVEQFENFGKDALLSAQNGRELQVIGSGRDLFSF